MDGNLMNSLTLLGVAFFNVVTAFMAWRTLQAGKRSEEQSKANSEQIAQIEKATNSMKDALVLAAGKEGFAEGVKAAGEVEVAISKIAPDDPLKVNVKAGPIDPKA